MSAEPSEPQEPTEPEPEVPLEGDLPEEPLVPEPEEPEEPAEPSEPSEPAPGLAEVDLEKVSKAMDRAAKSYIDKAVSNLGNDLSGFEACPMCHDYWPGLRLPRVPEGETLEAIRVAIGEPTHPHYAADKWSRPCDVCDGYGVVSTGSKVSGRGNAQCLECKGLGYIPTHSGRESGAVTVTNGATLPPSYDQAAPSLPEPPEVAALKALGYIVVEPVTPVVQ